MASDACSTVVYLIQLREMMKMNIAGLILTEMT